MIGVKDMFTGGLSEEARETAWMYNQLLSWVREKMTAVLQLTDTDVVYRLKACLMRKLMLLRRELIRLAELEQTRAIFKCGVYESLRMICEVLEEMREVFRREQTLKKGLVRNGWLALRPKVAEHRFVRVADEPWAQDVSIGSHRLRNSWVQTRFEHLGEDGMPTKPAFLSTPIEDQQGDTSYDVEVDEKQELVAWRRMAAEGQLTALQLRELSECPRVQLEVEAVDFDGLEEMRQLLKSPAELRRERGIDERLTSQLPNRKAAEAKTKKKHQLRTQMRAEMREVTQGAVQKLTAEGYTVDQISNYLIRPQVGKKRKSRSMRKTLRDRLSQKVLRSLDKRKRKLREEGEAAASEKKRQKIQQEECNIRFLDLDFD